MTDALLSPYFEDALLYASRLHAAQSRKGTAVPYIAHLLAVTALVLEDGGDEEQAIAALLHDAAEDQGGLDTLNEIRRRYGDRVAEIVAGLTDAYGHPKPPWRQRKERYLAHLQTATPEVRRVSLADKLHNARSILFDLRQHGDKVWSRFKGGKEGSLWYYRSLIAIFQEADRQNNLSSPMLHELKKVFVEIEALSGEV
jgi:(p)ppGpp synthase/HD superfamily hydrolase